MTGSLSAMYWFLSRTNQIMWRAKNFSASRFLQVFHRNGLVALIHQLHPEPVYVSERDWTDLPERTISGTLPKNMEGLVNELISRKLFVSGSDADLEEFKKAQDLALRAASRPTILYLMMAQGCNFACNYCKIPDLAKHYGEHLLSFEDATAGIGLWQRHIEDQPQDDNLYFLIFYGGEPLLNREVLERLLPYIAEEKRAGHLPDKLELMLCTNGSLVDASLARLLAKHEIMVAIGIDGPKNHNDLARITTDGKPTFTAIEDSVRLLVGAGIKVVASVTITPANIRELGQYPDFLRKLGFSQFGFNLMKGKALKEQLAGRSIEEYCRAAAQGVLLGLENETGDGHCYEYQLEKKLTAIRNGMPFSVDCTCYGNQLVIQADGQVSNCPFLRVDQGRIGELPDSFRIWQTDSVKMWKHRIPILSRRFEDWNFDGMLNGGGCAWSSLELQGSIDAEDTANTIFTKEITNELIWTLLPGEQADLIRQGKISHWSYRRLGTL